MAMGTGKEGKLEHSDHFRFLQHKRVYKIVLYGNGQPKDDNSFVLCDISDLEPSVLKVEVIENP